MRVFYPISARISEFANDGAEKPAGWMMLWSVFCVALLALVLAALFSFESAAANTQHELLSNSHLGHAARISVTHAKHCVVDSRATAQDYIDAHFCALHASCLKPVKTGRLSAAPAVSRAGGGLYL